MFGMAVAMGSLLDRSSESVSAAILFGVSSLIGLAIFGLMLRWLINTWRRRSP